MDISVLAAVGSFFVSERVLKPKATVLFVFACVLAYDLTTKTHDISSLRVYRGPALIAFSLLMSAFSLRTWRRNGVACDELLFLPGTPHGEVHGIDSPPVVATPKPRNDVDDSSNSGGKPPHRSLSAPIRSEGDVAAGVGVAVPCTQQSSNSPSPVKTTTRSSSSQRMRTQSESEVELAAGGGGGAGNATGIPQKQNTPGGNDSADISDSFNLSWETDDYFSEDSDDEKDNSHKNLLCRSNNKEGTAGVSPLSIANSDEDSNNNGPNSPLHNFRENHPQITRIGTFFFFRSSASSTQNAAYAPSGPAVVGAALDLSMPISFNFHLFIEAYNHLKKYGGSDATAKILPIIFLSVLIVRSFVPPGRRGRFWATIKFTMLAPFYHVRFRDAFIGDVLTSFVRPSQDILFALSYYVTVIWGSVTGKYDLSESGDILSHSWLLHNVILPSCAILPLWWRFLQTLREAYDEKKRWPHYGNAFKYLSATTIILYGMTHREDQRSLWWSFCFFLGVLYQVAWDTIMDWDLLEIAPKAPGESLDESDSCSICTRTSSVRPTSVVMLNLQMYIVQPISDAMQKIRMSIPSWNQIELRSKRLYKSKNFYYKIFAFNTAMRFTWMLCFIPAYHISSSPHHEGEQEITFSSDVNSYVGVMLPVAEIIRRTLWGFLYLERETIKMMEGGDSYVTYAHLDTSESGDMNMGSGDGEDCTDDDSCHYTHSSGASNKSNTNHQRHLLQLPTWMNAQQQMAHDAATQGSSSRRVSGNNIVAAVTNSVSEALIKINNKDFGDIKQHLFIVELTMWAVAFVGLGCWASS